MAVSMQALGAAASSSFRPACMHACVLGVDSNTLSTRVVRPLQVLNRRCRPASKCSNMTRSNSNSCRFMHACTQLVPCSLQRGRQ